MYYTDQDLLYKNRISCGNNCKAHKPKYDLTGQTFGYLTVLKLADKEANIGFQYECLCSCGKTVIKSGRGLKAGLYKSCGHIISYGETLTEKILNEKGINYRKQYSFPNLRGPKNGRLRFDFGILSKNGNLKYLIEYQGEQHYIARKNSDFGQREREITDKKKKDYCKEHKIHLYEIRYDENIEEAINKILSKETT